MHHKYSLFERVGVGGRELGNHYVNSTRVTPTTTTTFPKCLDLNPESLAWVFPQPVSSHPSPREALMASDHSSQRRSSRRLASDPTGKLAPPHPPALEYLQDKWGVWGASWGGLDREETLSVTSDLWLSKHRERLRDYTESLGNLVYIANSVIKFSQSE